MSEENVDPQESFTVFETHSYDLNSVATFSDTDPKLVQHYCEIGLIAISKKGRSGEPFFDDDAVYWLRQIRELRREGGSHRGLRMILELRRQIEELKRELRFRQG